jgi:hypothetical protein
VAAENGRNSGLKQKFVHVAPQPVFAGLDRLDDGVPGGVKMLSGVLVFRRIATADMAAFETEAQMDPGIAHLEALFATLGVRLGVFRLLQVNAGGTHSSWASSS